MPKSSNGRLLIVDDEIELMRALSESLISQNYEAVGVSTPNEALQLLATGEFDLLLSDLMMPGMDGITLLKKALEIDPQLVGVIMTGQGTIQTAVEAMKQGAFDYLLKPFKLQAILPTLARAMDVRRLKMENVRLRRYLAQVTFESSRYQIVGNSPGIRKVLQLIGKVAPTDSTVLIRGPSGSGKELVARAIHSNSLRKDHPLVTINCAALQETLLESELFGYEKGAFTGAVQSKIGLFEVAEGGTLFIDEIAEMAPGMQAKFLRVLENGHYRRVGGIQERHADVRVIAATNKNLEEEQKQGRFREDLFYRLNVITIQLPALADRKEDIPLLLEHFLSTRQIGQQRHQIDPVAMQVLTNYSWPGNIRELANVIERAQILAEGNTITIDDLPESLISVPIHSPLPSQTQEAPNPEALEEIERRHVQKILSQHHGNKVHTSKALGISRRALYRLIEKYRLDDSKEP